MECKEARILMAPRITGDLDSDPISYELDAHLLRCRACSLEYKAIRETIGLIDEHKSLFAAALQAVERNRVSEQQEMKRSWEAIEAKLAKIEVLEKPRERAFAFRTPWKAAAVAACLAIGVSIWMALSHHHASDRPVYQQESPLLAGLLKIEMLLDEGSISIPAGQQISTSANELKTLIINGRHRLTINADSVLSIEHFEKESRFGCMVKLASGEIFARVEHGGNPFVVNTAQGRAVITGTVFDVKATDTNTTLVVSEGTVQFESKKGLVVVKSGQISSVYAESAPTRPAICSAAELTTWARGHEIEKALAKIRPLSDDYDLSELWLTASSGRIDLEAIDYDHWVEKKQEWFEREFPWIFELQGALTKEGTDVDYDELLLKSGDIRQFVYPQVLPTRIPVLSCDSLLRVVSSYGFDKEWLAENVQSARYGAVEGGSTGLRAFRQWETDLVKASKLSAETVDSGTLLCSLHSSTYLTNTRTLMWLGLRNGILTLSSRDSAEALGLLEAQVNTTNELTSRIIRLFAISDAPCAEYQTLIGGAITDIGKITSIEKQFLEYEISK